jgi:hypothetical protein
MELGRCEASIPELGFLHGLYDAAVQPVAARARPYRRSHRRGRWSGSHANL